MSSKNPVVFIKHARGNARAKGRCVCAGDTTKIESLTDDKHIKANPCHTPTRGGPVLHWALLRPNEVAVACAANQHAISVSQWLHLPAGGHTCVQQVPLFPWQMYVCLLGALECM